MSAHFQPKLVAIVGGSGAGKTWLADRLQRAFQTDAMRLSLDDFYRDRSHLAPSRRQQINFDHPRAIDWARVKAVLHDFRAGRETQLPRYNFATHTRLPKHETSNPTPLVLMDGLWLLWHPEARRLFDFRIFLDCPVRLRLERRLARDVAERGRVAESVQEQFWRTVVPMHDRYVVPQTRWANLILKQPPSEAELGELTETLRSLVATATSAAGTARSPRGSGPFRPPTVSRGKAETAATRGVPASLRAGVPFPAQMPPLAGNMTHSCPEPGLNGELLLTTNARVQGSLQATLQWI